MMVIEGEWKIRSDKNYLSLRIYACFTVITEDSFFSPRCMIEPDDRISHTGHTYPAHTDADSRSKVNFIRVLRANSPVSETVRLTGPG
jgi:hypothetical protein